MMKSSRWLKAVLMVCLVSLGNTALAIVTYPTPAAPTGDDIQSIATVYDANNNPTRITETYSSEFGLGFSGPIDAAEHRRNWRE